MWTVNNKFISQNFTIFFLFLSPPLRNNKHYLVLTLTVMDKAANFVVVKPAVHENDCGVLHVGPLLWWAGVWHPFTKQVSDGWKMPLHYTLRLMPNLLCRSAFLQLQASHVS